MTNQKRHLKGNAHLNKSTRKPDDPRLKDTMSNHQRIKFREEFRRGGTVHIHNGMTQARYRRMKRRGHELRLQEDHNVGA